MKRTIALALLCALIFGCAAAEQAPRQKIETIWLEGLPEEVTLTRYESPLGFALWYDAAFFRPEPWRGETGTERFLRPEGGDASYELSLYKSPAGSAVAAVARDEALALLSSPGAVAQERDTSGLFGGRESFGAYAVADGLVRELYGVRTDAGFYFITLRCPLEALEGWGSRAYALIQSIEWGS